MATLQSEIYLCNNIKMDRNYINVLNYSTNDMLDLCIDHAVAHASNYSFIRETGQILVGYDYGTCLSANYMAYQNKDYSNKWFFAFIDKVDYVGERQTKISFTIDAWSTFFSDMHFNSVFINKEHVNSDNFGEHTLPEGLETGEYVLSENNVDSTLISYTDGISICVATSKGTRQSVGSIYGQGQLVNNIFQALDFAVFSDYPNTTDPIIKKKEEAVNMYLNYFATHTGYSQDDIIDIFMIPNKLLGGNYTTEDLENDPGSLKMRIKYLDASTSPILLEDLLLADNRKLAGDYVPKNTKLLHFPYRYLLASNGTGQDVVYNWEDFSEEYGTGMGWYVRFDSYGDFTPNGSMKCIPQNYKGLASNYNEAINFSKYPTCSWIYDAYTNWMTQNNINNGIRTIGGLVKITSSTINLASSIATEPYMSGVESTASEAGATIGSGINDIMSVMMEQYQHQFDPNQSRGNINCGDINFSKTNNEIQFYKMSIKREYAVILDGYFNRFGYTVNTFKTPNITGRPYWNYVKTTSGEKTVWGTIPAIYIDEINRAFSNGVTIWHNHSNMGNFTLDNSL